jgi:hypothetical protein
VGIIPSIRGELGNEGTRGQPLSRFGCLGGRVAGWQGGRAGHCENADVGIVDQQGLELPSLATSNAKMARKPRAAAPLRLKLCRLGFGYGHPWCLEVIEKQEKGWPGREGCTLLGLVPTSEQKFSHRNIQSRPRQNPSGLCFQQYPHRWSQCLSWPLPPTVVV